MVASSGSQIARLIDEAMDALTGGDLTRAEATCRDALALEPADRTVAGLLGAVVLSQGRYGEAELTFLKLAEQEPDTASHWVNVGLARRGLGQYDAALRAFAEAARLGEDAADFHFNLGLVHLDRADYEAARAVLARARDLDPLNAETRLRYAQACYRSLQSDDAALALTDWPSFTRPSPAVLAQIGQLLVNLGQSEAGQQALRAALTSPGADAATLLAGIETFERVNRLDDAQALVERLEGEVHSAAIDEDLLVVRARLAQRRSDYVQAERLYSQALVATSDTALKHMELFPLAQCLDAEGRYDEAWQTLKEAHASQREYLRRVAPALVLTGAPPMAITARGSSVEDLRAWDDDAPGVEDSPVFIVAFPRSGTTLLELTLDAHPGLQSMDEQPFIQEALDQIVALGVDYPATLGQLSRSQLAELRATYWRRVAGKIALRGDARLVDKNPLNILRLPVIRRLFPNAPILLAVRHPCDVILSCYMQHFRAPEFALLCNALPTLARGYERSMDFWCREMPVLGGRNLEIRYETLVQDFESSVRGIIEFLALPWDDRALRPADQARAKGYISTPSYAEVVRPVSSASVDRWRRYAPHFAPVLPLVQAQLARWNYSAVVAVDGVSPNSR